MVDNNDVMEDVYNEQPPEPPPDWDQTNLQVEIKTQSHQKRWTAAELLDAEFPEPKWAIPELIPEGLGLLGGRPKVGKSWLLLQASISVGTGGVFFGKRCEKGHVLYVALEDGPRRLQDRIKKMGMPHDALVTIQRGWRPMQKGGLDDLVAELAATDYRMVIFDTLTRAFPGVSQKDHPEVIGQVIDQIQTIATNRNISILFCDHTRKPNGLNNDPVDDILYTSEKVKSADYVLALYKKQGKTGASLLGRGRDMDEIDLDLFWDAETFAWQCKGGSDELKITGQELEILDALKSFGRARMIDIATATGINKGNVYRALGNLWTSGQIHKDDSGKDTYYEIK